MAGLAPDVVKPETADFLAEMLGPRGRTIGVFAGDTLGAYGILQHDVPPADDPRAGLGIACDRPLLKLAGASVAPALRGRGLQRALIAARVALAEADAAVPPLLFATSAPANVPSWTNLLAEGFGVRALKPYYGGYPRYVMVRPVAPDAGEAESVMEGDPARQADLLNAGWHGIAQRTGPHGPILVFARRTTP